MATALDLDEGDRREPVIASSNRAADVEPYAKGLFAEDPKKWMQVLPWEFPYGERPVEDQFLRQFFTDREIRKQGGAHGAGNGYRFLKQVWLWAAMWNANQRIPMIAWDWMQKNQALINDPTMLPHLLSNEVKPSTFFTSEEIEMYSEKVLVYAVNGIQAMVQQRADEAAAPGPESGQDAADGADATNISVEQNTITQIEAPTEQPNEASTSSASPTLPAADPPAVAKTDEAASNPTASEQPVAPTIGDTVATTKADEHAQIVTAPAGKGDSAIVQVTTAHTQGNRNRNFSSGSNVIEDRQLSFNRGRGNRGKRNSFNQPRHSPRGPPTFGDPRHVSNPYPSYAGAPAQMSPMPPGSAPLTHRFPSGSYPSPMAHMPTVPQGQQLYAPPPPPGYPTPMQQPYAPSMPQQHMYSNTMSPAAASYQYGPASNAYVQGPPPFADRSNVHPNTRHFSNEQHYHAMSDHPDHRFGRRDSVQSRGVKGRGGYGGSVRGRGNRGRGSIGNEGQFMTRNGPYEVTTAPFPPHHNTFRTERDGDWHSQQWQARGQPEGSFAHSNSYNAADHGSSRYPQRSYQGNGPIGSGPNDPRAGSGQHSLHNKNGHPCTAGCTKFDISETCRTATKLIIFNVAPSLDMKECMHFFSGFGRVRHVSEPKQSSYAEGKPGRWYLFVSFDDVSAARKCMASKGRQWPGGMLLPEVAMEHWSEDRYRAASNYHRLSNASGASTTTALPDQGAQGAPPQQQLADRQAPPIQRETQSGYSTPIATDSSNTPTPSQVGTPKPKKTSKSKSKKRRSERQQEISNDEASESKDGEDGGARDDAEKSAEDASPTLEAEDTKEPEEDQPISQDVSPAAEDINVGVADETLPKAGGEVDATPTVPSTEPVVVFAKTESAPDKPAESDNFTEESAQSIKHDDDCNDESFHTASGSPGAEKELTLGEDDVAITSTPPDQEDTQKESVSAAASDMGSAHGSESTLSKSSVKSTSPPKESKKAPIPQVTSQKNVTIAVPPIDIEKAEASSKAQPETLQVPQQRSASGNSEPKTPAFVTAPSTPAIPDTPQEPRSKKAPKPKGPEQTESFSIFSKPKRKASKAKDKKTAGKRKGSALETVDDMEMAEQAKQTSGTPRELEKSGTKQEEPFIQATKSQPEEAIAQPFPTPVIVIDGAKPGGATLAEVEDEDDSKPELSSKAAGKRPVGQSETTTSTPDDAVTSSPPAAAEKLEHARPTEQEEVPVGLGISGGSQAVTTSRKKNGNNRKKNTKKGSKGVAEVTEMSHPGVDNHTTKSTYEFKGNDLGDETQEPKPKPNDANAIATASQKPGNLINSPNSHGSGPTGDIDSPGKKVQIEIDRPIDNETPKVRHHLRQAEDISDLFDRSVAAAVASPASASDTSTVLNIKVSEDIKIIYIVPVNDDDERQTATTAKAVEAKQEPHEEEEPENETVRNSKMRIAKLKEQEEQVKKTKGKQTETQ